MLTSWKKRGRCGRDRKYLHLDIEDTNESLVGNIFNSRNAGPIVVTRELGVFDECVFGDEGFKFLAGYEMVFDTVGFSGTGQTGCVCTYGGDLC